MNLREKKGKKYARDEGNSTRPAIFKIVFRLCCFLFRTYVGATNCISVCASVIRGLKNCMRRNYKGRTTEDKRDVPRERRAKNERKRERERETGREGDREICALKATGLVSCERTEGE